MGISKFIESICVQPAVYWGVPVPDGYGGFTFTTPVAIMVRWDEKTQLVINQTGQQVVSNAEIFVTGEKDVGGLIYLGDISDWITIPGIYYNQNPLTVPAVKMIIAKSKTPMIKSNSEFVHKIFV